MSRYRRFERYPRKVCSSTIRYVDQIFILFPQVTLSCFRSNNATYVFTTVFHFESYNSVQASVARHDRFRLEVGTSFCCPASTITPSHTDPSVSLLRIVYLIFNQTDHQLTFKRTEPKIY